MEIVIVKMMRSLILMKILKSNKSPSGELNKKIEYILYFGNYNKKFSIIWKFRIYMKILGNSYFFYYLMN